MHAEGYFGFLLALVAEYIMEIHVWEERKSMIMYVLNKRWNGKGLSQGAKPGTGGLYTDVCSGRWPCLCG